MHLTSKSLLALVQRRLHADLNKSCVCEIFLSCVTTHVPCAAAERRGWSSVVISVFKDQHLLEFDYPLLILYVPQNISTLARQVCHLSQSAVGKFCRDPAAISTASLLHKRLVHSDLRAGYLLAQ